MPSICCVPNCNTNYRNGPRLSVFSFPEDEALRKKWIIHIHRKDFKPSKHSRVCELHFKPSDIVRETSAFDEKTGKLITVQLKTPRLVAGAIPVLMPNCPSYLSSSAHSRENPDIRRERLEQDAICQAIQNSIEDKRRYDNLISFSNLEELHARIHLLETNDFWTVIPKDKCMIICHLEMDHAPTISISIMINKELEASVYLEKTMLKNLEPFGQMPTKISNANDLNSILREVKTLQEISESRVSVEKGLSFARNLLDSISNSSENHENCLNFITEQLSLIGCNQHRKKYSPNMIVFSSLLHSISPAAYTFLRQSGHVILPHPSTIHNICLSLNNSALDEQQNGNFLQYIKYRSAMLSLNDKKVILMVDEIHVKTYFDYKGGNIVGASFNDKAGASSAYVFMVSSIMSTFKEVVHIVPSKSMIAKTLHDFMKKVIIGLERIGFTVVCVITDNNSINRKAVSLFVDPPKFSIVYPHPENKSRPLFFMIDSVHLLKCIRNNWINQRNPEKNMYYPTFVELDLPDKQNFSTASFNTLRKLHAVEKDSLLKYGYNLSLKSLSPSNLEKQNVKLVMKIFNNFVAKGLIEVGKKLNLPHYKETADYIELICTWWNIVNVKTAFKGSRLNDQFKEPLTSSVDDKSYQFLSRFLDWLHMWQEMKCDTGMLTKETHSALTLTTHCLMELVNYCTTELGMHYILPGKFQTDCLESRFGLYRQLAGSQYHISMRQLFECENKLRMQSVMKLALSSKKFGDISLLQIDTTEKFEELGFTMDKQLLPVCFQITEDDVKIAQDSLPVVTYLAGYCVYAALKRVKCNSCKMFLVIDDDDELTPPHAFISSLNRGKLLYPQDCPVNVVLYNYIVIKKLCSEFENIFLKHPNQRHLATELTMDVIKANDCLGIFDMCDDGHSGEDILKMIIWSSTNALLNNYCKKLNDVSLLPKVKQRKLMTFK